jgi:FtsH-binding integral membrane protein
MKGRIFFAAVFLIIGLVAGWMTWLTHQADQSSKWFFGVLATFFIILSGVPFLPAKKKNESAEVQGTRFVPAWKMEGMILLAIVLITLALVIPHCVHPP